MMPTPDIVAPKGAPGQRETTRDIPVGATWGMGQNIGTQSFNLLIIG